MWQGQIPKIRPQRIGGDVSHDHGLPPKRRRATGTHRRTDGRSINGRHEFWRQTGRGSMPQVPAISVKQQNRAQHFRQHCLHMLQHESQRLLQWRRLGDFLQHLGPASNDGLVKQTLGDVDQHRSALQTIRSSRGFDLNRHRRPSFDRQGQFTGLPGS